MKTMHMLLAALLTFVSATAAKLPAVSSGKLIHIEKFQSALVEPRNVDIWLPDGYSKNQKYAVLYMHDGQMLFDSTTTWNHQSWEADKVASSLMKKGKTVGFIVVGIYSLPSRYNDYFPQKPFESLTKAEVDSLRAHYQQNIKSDFKIYSDNYLKFIVGELKPYIDSHYSTYTDARHTCIAGSSMGGLISMYAICEYPAVFGGAACLSTHWSGVFSLEKNPIPNAFFNYLRKNLPKPENHKIYFDYGDQTLDALYPTLQKQVDEIMRAKGFDHRSWTTRFFPGENHSEKAWHKRLDIPLLFLLGK